MVKKLGIGAGPGWEGEMDACGEHTSNPLAGPPDMYPFYMHGGLTLGDGLRSMVDHYRVDRKPMIAHPFPDVQEGR